MNRKLTLILALLVLALVSVSIVAAVNETPDQMAADDDSDDKMSQDNDDEKITADDKPVLGVIEFPVKIVWEDNDNNARKRPSSVIVIVNAGENTRELELTDINDWRGEANIPDADADSISVQDVHVDGYTTKIVGNPKDGYEITCTYIDDSNDNSTDTDDDNQNDPADDDTDDSDDDSDDTPDNETQLIKTITTTTKVVKKEPKKVKDKHNTGNPILLGVLAISVAGLAYQLRRKE